MNKTNFLKIIIEVFTEIFSIFLIFAAIVFAVAVVADKIAGLGIGFHWIDLVIDLVLIPFYIILRLIMKFMQRHL